MSAEGIAVLVAWAILLLGLGWVGWFIMRSTSVRPADFADDDANEACAGHKAYPPPQFNSDETGRL